MEPIAPSQVRARAQRSSAVSGMARRIPISRLSQADDSGNVHDAVRSYITRARLIEQPRHKGLPLRVSHLQIGRLLDRRYSLRHHLARASPVTFSQFARVLEPSALLIAVATRFASAPLEALAPEDRSGATWVPIRASVWSNRVLTSPATCSEATRRARNDPILG